MQKYKYKTVTFLLEVTVPNEMPIDLVADFLKSDTPPYNWHWQVGELLIQKVTRKNCEGRRVK